MQAEHSQSQQPVLPTVLPMHTVAINQGVTVSEDITSKVQSHHFAQLADAAALQLLRPELIEIDIAQELQMLEHNDYLEVTLPVVGILDLLNPETAQHNNVIAKVMALNGLAAGEQVLPEHVVAIDLVGNKYEILIDNNGNITLPEEGSGLFSVMSAITLMYGKSQLLDGQGLDDVTALGYKKGALYLLPPTELVNFYDAKLTVSYLNEHFDRNVSSIRSISLQPEGHLTQALDMHVDVAPLSGIDGNGLSLQVDGQVSAQILRGPISLTVSLPKIANTEYHVDSEFDAAKGWQQHVEYNNVFSKPLGLEPATLQAFVQQAYTIADLHKDMIGGDNFNLSNEQGYNDFVLQTEGVMFFHEKFIEGLSIGQLPGSELLGRVQPSHFDGIDLSAIAVNEHDFQVLDNMYDPIDGFNPAQLGPYLAHSEDNLHEVFLLNTTGEGFEQTPNAYAYLEYEQPTNLTPNLIDTNEPVINLSEQAMNNINTISFYEPELISELNSLASEHVNYGDTSIHVNQLDAGFSPLLAADIFGQQSDLAPDDSGVNLDALLPDVGLEAHSKIEATASTELSSMEYNQGVTNPFMFDEMPLMIGHPPEST